MLICIEIREWKTSENFLSTKITFQAEYGCTSILALLHYMYMLTTNWLSQLIETWEFQGRIQIDHTLSHLLGVKLYTCISIQRNLYKEKSQNFTRLMDILLLELHYTVGQLEGHRGIHAITKIIDHTLSQFVGSEF